MISLAINNIRKNFGDFAAVDEVSLNIEAGELFFILGPSGCGKTTLLRLIAGFYRPDAGRIFFGERDITDLPPEKRNAGMVFQNYALWPHMTVSQNVSFGLEMHRVPAAQRRQRVLKALEMVHMADYADHWPNQLSGGQQQRIALARALVIEPDVVLLDEPLSNLDAKLRLEMRRQIANLHKTLGLTMIYVTHDQSEALSMADRVALMHAGKLVQLDTPRALYDRPASRFVAGFIGEANILSGELVHSGGKTVVRTAAGELVAANVPPGLADGSAVHCCIRPEKLLLGGRGGNRLSARHVRTEYLGNHEQHFLCLPDGTEIKSIDSAAADVAAGGDVALSCSPEDVTVLRD